MVARPADGPPDRGDQDEVLAFLSEPASWTPRPDRVGHIETHGAHVFLGVDRALKIKRGVRYGYMDFSTLEKRRIACEREFAINSRAAPQIYLGVVAIRRATEDGRLAVGGDGTAVEWAVEMRRFDEQSVLTHVARRGALPPSLVKHLAEAVYRSHRQADVAAGDDMALRNRALVNALADEIARLSGPRDRDAIDRFRYRALDLVALHALLLAARGADGQVRRCHGDLHLDNIVVLDGKPILFDAIEFDEALATVDTLYDLAFLLMDLEVRGHRAEANLLLGHYLWLDGRNSEIEALKLLPLFLAQRAAVRAMVGLERAGVVSGRKADPGGLSPSQYLRAALDYLEPPPPKLVAIGGLSGTGKSTLAAALAPIFGAAPGALHLRSDLERKHLAGASETERLPPRSYTAEASTAVYERLFERARTALAANRSCIVDAVFAGEHERSAIEAVATDLGIPFEGLWLTVPRDAMVARIEARRHDASDATEKVATSQLARGAGRVTWPVLDTSGSPDLVRDAAMRSLGLP